MKASVCDLKAPFSKAFTRAVFWLYQYSAFPLSPHHLSETKFHFKKKQSTLYILKIPLSRNEPYIPWDLTSFIYSFIKWKYRIFPRNHQMHWPYRYCLIYLASPPISLVDTDIISYLFQQCIETRISWFLPVAVTSPKTDSPLLFLTSFYSWTLSFCLPVSSIMQTKPLLKPQSQVWTVTVLQPACHVPFLFHAAGGFRFVFPSFSRSTASHFTSVCLAGQFV